MANQQVPDFNAIALNMTNISIEEASLATQVGRMQNVANLNVGYQILQALAELSLRLDNRFNDIHTRLDAWYRKSPFSLFLFFSLSFFILFTPQLTLPI